MKRTILCAAFCLILPVLAWPAPASGPPGTNSGPGSLQGNPAPGEVSAGAMLTHPPPDYGWIPPGQFTMGSPETETDRSSEEGPPTVVRLTRGFYMSKRLVTQGE